MPRCTISLLILLTFLAGCRNSQEPRLRISSYFGSVGGMEFADPSDLGKHNFAAQRGEKNGMVYTCKAGFVDLGHVRESADRTAYAYNLIYQNIMMGKTQFSFRIIEPSHYQFSLVYPSDWHNRTGAEQEYAARQVALRLGQDSAHISLIWHEIITWYGFASTGLFSEQISSFSWEDTYSDALGTVIAVEALRQDRPYNEAVTDVLSATLKELDVQSPRVAYQAFKKVEGEWFEGGLYFFVKMNKRNFDTGFVNGQVVPWLVPGICPSGQPKPCHVSRPRKDELFGFTADLKLQPNVMEEGKIYRALELKGNPPLKPAQHFPILLLKIMDEAKTEYGFQVSVPSLHSSAALSRRFLYGEMDAAN